MFPWEILDTIMDSGWAGIRLGLTCRRLLARMRSIDVDQFATFHTCDYGCAYQLPNGVLHGPKWVESWPYIYNRGRIIDATHQGKRVWRIEGAQVQYQGEFGESITVRYIRFTPNNTYYGGYATGKIPPPEILALFADKSRTPEVISDWLDRAGIVFHADPDSPLVLDWSAPVANVEKILPGCIFRGSD